MIKLPPFVLLVGLIVVSSIHGVVAKVAPSYNPHRRETPVDGTLQPQPQQVAYSTLPEALLRGAGGGGGSAIQQQQQPNFFNFPVDQAQQQQPQLNLQSSGDPFAFQQQPQQQEQFGFQQGQPSGFQQQQQFNVGFPEQNNGGFQQQGFSGDFGGFEASNNEIEEDSSPGFFTSIMNYFLDGTGIGGLLNRAREMFSGFSDTFGGGAMSRVAMGMMALPLMIPMAAIPIGLGAMGLMAFPILQLTLPGIRRSMSHGASILGSEECMERLSCNLAKRFDYDALFSRLERSENRWLNRVSKSVKAARTGEDCKQFNCSPVSRMQAMVRTYILGDEAKDAKEANTT